MWWAGLLVFFTFSWWFWNCNIMFVSVKERTNWDSKSLGAKNRFILFHFLFEAIILSVIGGIIGLLLVWIISYFDQCIGF
jgi:putative ABC transport system permease protein